jgi:hypothetical protein
VSVRRIIKVSAITVTVTVIAGTDVIHDLGTQRLPEMSAGMSNERPASSISAGPTLEPEAEVVLGDATGTRVKKYVSAGLVTLVAAPTGRTEEGVAVFSQLPQSGEHSFTSASIVLIGDRAFGVTLHDVSPEYAIALAARSDLASLLQAS